VKNLALSIPQRLNARPVILALLAALGLLLAQTAWHSYESAREQALRVEADDLRAARPVALHQESAFDQASHLLRVLRGVSLPERYSPATCNAFLARQLESFPEYDNLAFVADDGTVRCSAHPTQFPLPTMEHGARASDGALAVAFSGDQAVLMLPRTSSDHSAYGGAAAYLPLRKLFEDSSGAMAPESQFGLIDANGKLVAVFPAGSAWTNDDPTFSRALVALDSGIVTRLPDAKGAVHLYVSQPIMGAQPKLRLIARFPADAADGVTRTAGFLVGAYAFAAFMLWLLVRLAAVRLGQSLTRIEWRRLQPWPQMKRAATALGTRFTGLSRAQPKQPAPGETTALRTAYEELKRSFAHEEERMSQIIRLDELSQTLQSCTGMNELAEAVARCTADLFPGSSGALLVHTGPGQMETVLDWGKRAPTLTPRSDHICIPLATRGQMVGMLHLQGAGRTIPWAATSIAERAAAAIVSVRHHEHLQQRATRDALTGLYNRRFMEEALGIEQRQALRGDSPIGVMMIDVDHFKRFNDSFGHDAGDALLRGIGGILRRIVRQGDLACRYGGEEFVLILPGADLAGTRQRAESLRATIERWQPKNGGSALSQVTVSVGVAAFPAHGETWQTVLKVADQALYQAKHGGRNRVASPRGVMAVAKSAS
jgi:diguanylate cyclase (GGDEF)-like protein